MYLCHPYILQHFSKNVFTLVSLVFTVCSNVYKPTGFRSTSLAYLYHNMRNPIFTDVGIWGYACYDCCMLSSLPLSACMLNFDLVSILFGTSIPTSFNILVKMFLHLFHWFLLCVATCINRLAFVLPPLHTYNDSQQLAVTPTSCLVRILHTE